MLLRQFRLLPLAAIIGLTSAQTLAQAPTRNIQPGLETAVKWKWQVQPTDEKDWGLESNVPAEAPPPPPKETPGGKKEAPHETGPSITPGDYEIKKGDALASIARKAGISVDHLKRFNGLTKDLIRAGQILKIPTPEEIAALNPPPPPPPPPQAPVDSTTTPAPKKGKKGRKTPPAEPEMDVGSETILFQVLLDRENFSSGPLDGNRGVAFDHLLGFYQNLHPDLQTFEALRTRAISVVGAPFTHYRLKRSDFRFIDPPKAEAAPPPPPKVVSTPKGKGKKVVEAPKPPPPPPVTYQDLLAEKFSGYHSPWEFVAERFHCDEAYLRLHNFKIKGTPTVDTEFEVPNVTPFEIEKCFTPGLRPAANAEKPITATIADFTRLEIHQGDQLIAVLPVSRARPDLRGKGSWTILDAVVAPRLATRQELKSPPKPVDPATSAPLTLDSVARPNSTPAPPPQPAPPPPTLASDQILAAGPRNPVGIYWINLAKANSTTPLPYGLHGTAIPGKMNSQESLGGLRMTNWDIARVMRILPEGTPLVWK